MPNKTVSYLLQEFQHLKDQFAAHIEESGSIKTDIRWLKWINMGIAALVFFKMVADFIKT